MTDFGLNPKLVLVPVSETPDGGKVFKTNFWDLLAALTPPGMVVAKMEGEKDD